MGKRKHSFNTLRYKKCLQKINTELKNRRKMMSRFVDCLCVTTKDPEFVCFSQYTFVNDYRQFARGFYDVIDKFRKDIEELIVEPTERSFFSYKKLLANMNDGCKNWIKDNKVKVSEMMNGNRPVYNKFVGIYAAIATVADITLISLLLSEKDWADINFKDEEPIKVIFLDVDGVLNCASDLENGVHISDEKLDYLQEIVEKSGAKVVLSSSWRELSSEHPHRIMLESKLAAHGIVLYGRTPFSKKKWKYGGRPQEIKSWLGRHPEVTAWVNLDDDYEEYFYERIGMDGHTVHTEFYGGGLKKEHVDEALTILSMAAQKGE